MVHLNKGQTICLPSTSPHAYGITTWHPALLYSPPPCRRYRRSESPTRNCAAPTKRQTADLHRKVPQGVNCYSQWLPSQTIPGRLRLNIVPTASQPHVRPPPALPSPSTQPIRVRHPNHPSLGPTRSSPKPSYCQTGTQTTCASS